MFTDSTDASQNRLIKMVTDTRKMVEQRKREVPLAGMHALASMQRRPYDISSYLREHHKLPLIAQIKRHAPEMQDPLANYDPVVIAKRFEACHVSGLMLATNQQYYLGSIVDLTLVTQNVSIPVIRQDFVYDEYQIVEARAAGADGVLLIAALLEPAHLRELISITQRNRMAAIVQVQSQEEVLQSIEFEPRVIAISNRDMHDFTIDLDTTLRLRPLIPRHIMVMSMGGLRTAADVAYVRQANLDAVVVGQAILNAPDPSAAIYDLLRPTETAIP